MDDRFAKTVGVACDSSDDEAFAFAVFPVPSGKVGSINCNKERFVLHLQSIGLFRKDDKMYHKQKNEQRHKSCRCKPAGKQKQQNGYGSADNLMINGGTNPTLRAQQGPKPNSFYKIIHKNVFK